MSDTQTSTIAIITGGNRGLGRATALALARRGTDVLLTYRSDPEEADGVVRELRGLGRTAVALRLDTTEVETFERFAADVRDALREHWQRDTFDALVNNAGVGLPTTLGDTTVADVDALYAVHVKGPYFLTQALAPLLADGGRILNLSSGLARFVGGPWSAYAAMKGAVEVLTRYWAQELGPRGIAVNVLAPGATATDFGAGHVRDDEALRAQIAQVVAMGHVGEPDDVGDAAASILADGMRWATGQRIEASGGQRL